MPASPRKPYQLKQPGSGSAPRRFRDRPSSRRWRRGSKSDRSGFGLDKDDGAATTARQALQRYRTVLSDQELVRRFRRLRSDQQLALADIITALSERKTID